MHETKLLFLLLTAAAHGHEQILKTILSKIQDNFTKFPHTSYHHVDQISQIMEGAVNTVRKFFNTSVQCKPFQHQTMRNLKASKFWQNLAKTHKTEV